MDFEAGRNVAVEVIEKREKCLVAMARLALGDNRPIERVERCEQRGGALPIIIAGHPFDVPTIGSTGRVRSGAWIWLFSSTHGTSALSGGLR